jgi:hypothetical protein
VAAGHHVVRQIATSGTPVPPARPPISGTSRPDAARTGNPAAGRTPNRRPAKRGARPGRPASRSRPSPRG